MLCRPPPAAIITGPQVHFIIVSPSGGPVDMASGAESRRQHPQTTEENLRVAVATTSRFSCTILVTETVRSRLRCVELAHRVKVETGRRPLRQITTNYVIRQRVSGSIERQLIMIKKPPEAWMECKKFTGDMTISERSCMDTGRRTAVSAVRVMWTVQWNMCFGNAAGLKREEKNSRSAVEQSYYR